MVQIETDESFDAWGDRGEVPPTGCSTGARQRDGPSGGMDAERAVDDPVIRSKLRLRDARAHPRTGADATPRLNPEAYRRITTLAAQLRGDARAVRTPLTPKWPCRHEDGPTGDGL